MKSCVPVYSSSAHGWEFLCVYGDVCKLCQVVIGISSSTVSHSQLRFTDPH